MSRWRNWSGKHQCQPKDIHFVRSTADAQARVVDAAANATKVRTAGAGHSHAPIVVTDGIVIDSSGLSGVVEVDVAAKQAWVRAGSPIYSLGVQLHSHGLALKNQGDIDRQFIAGAVSTGTHGTGKNLQNLSASVVGLKLVLANGEIVTCSATEEVDLFQAARLSVGSIGLITDIKMQLQASTVLKESGRLVKLSEFFDDISSLCEQHERFEFFWYPQSDEATIKTITTTTEPPSYPLAAEGERQAFSYEVLPSYRPHLHTEMEYSIPADQGPACLQAIAELLRNKFPEVRWPVEYRTVAADDVWLSMAYQRPTVTISVHQDIREPDEPYFRACEEVFRAFDGRPHWGKVNYLGAEEFAAIYPRWSDWWQVRDQVDPKQIFLNDWAESVRP